MASRLGLRCAACDYRWDERVTDREGAFAETRAARVAQSGPCERCGSSRVEYWGHGHPRLSRSLLEEWSRDEGLNLGPIEEDVLLGIHSELDDLIWLLKQPDVLKRKRWDLVAALCHLFLISLEEKENGALPQDERENHAETIRVIRGVLMKHRTLALEAHNAEDYCLGLDFDNIIMPMLEDAPKTA